MPVMTSAWTHCCSSGGVLVSLEDWTPAALSHWQNSIISVKLHQFISLFQQLWCYFLSQHIICWDVNIYFIFVFQNKICYQIIPFVWKNNMKCRLSLTYIFIKNAWMACASTAMLWWALWSLTLLLKADGCMSAPTVVWIHPQGWRCS